MYIYIQMIWTSNYSTNSGHRSRAEGLGQNHGKPSPLQLTVFPGYECPKPGRLVTSSYNTHRLCVLLGLVYNLCKELAALEVRVRKMVISGAMDLDTASNVLGYRITGCSPEKKKPRTDVDTKEAKSTEPPPSQGDDKIFGDGMSDRGPPNDCPAEAG